MPTAGGKKSAPKAHKLAEQFPKGLVLRDLFKKEWLLGDVVGQGGFGMIYLASQSDSKNKADHVIKIEPKNNGPLFCEMTFYQRIGRKDLIQAFISQHKLQYLPVPPFISTGMHEYKSNEYRFLAMPRYGTDLQKRLVESGGTFPAKLVFPIGLRIIDALQYLHENEYVHADVKAANILQGYQQPNQVHLVDYGLAYRYTVEGIHKVYKEDPRKAHDGTIEFTSRDAHKGVFPSRRADMEILGYNLLQWLCGQLPWENKLSDAVYVASCKEKFFQSVSKSVSACFSGSANPNSVYSDIIVKFLDLVKGLKYDDTPDYNKFRGFLKDGLKKEGQKNEWSIDFAKDLKRKSSGDSSTSPIKKAKSSPIKKTKTPLKKPKTSPVKKTKTSPSKKTNGSPRKATPKKKLITPMTPKSPAANSPQKKTQARKPPANRNGSSKKTSPASKSKTKRSSPLQKKSPAKAAKISKKDTPMASPSTLKNLQIPKGK